MKFAPPGSDGWTYADELAARKLLKTFDKAFMFFLKKGLKWLFLWPIYLLKFFFKIICIIGKIFFKL